MLCILGGNKTSSQKDMTCGKSTGTGEGGLDWKQEIAQKDFVAAGDESKGL